MQRKASSQLIESPENEVFRRLRRLARRREPGLALLEGPRVVGEAAAVGIELELLVLREGDECPVEATRTVTLTRALFSAISQTVTPQGVLAIARVRESSTDEAVAAAQSRRWPLVVLDRVQDPGNVLRLTVARADWGALADLEGYGAAAVGGTPLADTPIENAGMIVLGSEAHGLSRNDLRLVTVPLAVGVESLNVAAAAALLLFEVRRRRAA